MVDEYVRQPYLTLTTISGSQETTLWLANATSVALSSAERRVLDAFACSHRVEQILSQVAQDDILGRLAELQGLPQPFRKWISLIHSRMNSYRMMWKAPSTTTAQYREVIDCLLRRDLLVSTASLQIAIARNLVDNVSMPTGNLSIAVIGIPTAGRGDAVLRSLASARRAISESRWSNLTTVIVDDEKTEAVPGSLRCRLKDWSLENNATVLYMGRRQRNVLCSMLSRASGVPQATVHFACSNESEHASDGSARNCLSLLSITSPMLSFDDDTIFTFRKSPDSVATEILRSETVRFSGSGEPCDTQFMTSTQACEMHDRSRIIDPLELHEGVLGKRIPELLHGFDPSSLVTRWHEINAELTDACLGSGIVMMTSTGCAGDIGLSSSLGPLLLASDDTADLIGYNDALYRAAVEQRVVFRAAPSLTLSRGKYFQSMSFAADQRALHPPFLPLWRNSDGVFASSLYKMHPGGLLAHLPEAITHLPEVGRVYGFSHRDAVRQWRASDIVGAIVNQMVVAKSWTAEARLVAIGRRLSEVGELQKHAFLDLLVFLYLGRQQALLGYCEKSLSSCHIRARTWLEDLIVLRGTIIHSMKSGAYLCPSEFLLYTEDWDKRLQVEIGRCGAVFSIWDELRRTAKNIDLTQFNINKSYG